ELELGSGLCRSRSSVHDARWKSRSRRLRSPRVSHLRLIPPRGIVHIMTNIIDLDITGMTCSSCAARIEKKLNRVEGCEATVNFATERARVEVSEGVSADDLIDVVKKTGYGASRVAPEPTAEPGGQSGHDHRQTGHDRAAVADDDELRALRQRAIGSLLLAGPVILLSMIPALQFEYWQWLCLTLAAP